MRGQSSQYDCGPAALYNVLCALGEDPSLEKCEEVCEATQVDGTSPAKLRAGIKAMGLSVVTEIREKRDLVAMLRLANHLAAGQPAILAVDGDSHWVAVVGVLGNRYIVADSEDNELVLSLEEGTLMNRWWSPEAPRSAFYAVVVDREAK